MQPDSRDNPDRITLLGFTRRNHTSLIFEGGPFEHRVVVAFHFKHDVLAIIARVPGWKHVESPHVWTIPAAEVPGSRLSLASNVEIELRALHTKQGMSLIDLFVHAPRRVHVVRSELTQARREQQQVDARWRSAWARSKQNTREPQQEPLGESAVAI